MADCAPDYPAIPEAAFEEPWHGQVFALTVALNESGLFAWSEWAEMFGAQLAKDGTERPLDGSGDYYRAWVTTLESMVVSKADFEPTTLTQMKNLWSEAFLTTPHGAPVSPKKLV